MAGKEGNELQYLNHYYEKEGSQLVVLYGQKNIGMTELVREFSYEKPVSYYKARPCSEREQRYLWGNELNSQGATLVSYPSYQDLFFALIKTEPGFYGISHSVCS